MNRKNNKFCEIFTQILCKNYLFLSKKYSKKKRGVHNKRDKLDHIVVIVLLKVRFLFLPSNT